VLERRGTPAVLHGEQPEPSRGRLACLCEPVSPAVVIGSAQPAGDFDADRLARSGADLVRRRSGGGAVLVEPGRQVWLDVFVPKGDDLSHPDVGKSFYWLGDVFAEAIAAVLGTSPAAGRIEVHRGTIVKTPWSKVLCYAGLGAGEVTVDGRKVVGMSQRRERTGAWIHCMALLGDSALGLAELVSGPEQRRAKARGALVSAGLRDGEHLAGPLRSELLSRLS
jgi:lipoate-protein ligase A